MPIEFRAIPEHKLIIMTHEGPVSDEEFLESYRSYYESDRFDPTASMLVDLRRADSALRTPETLEHFAQFVGTKLAGAPARPKVAVVAPADVSFGLARMYEAFASSIEWDFVVFRALDAALAWLGVPDSVLAED
jgi:hypothetical protein